MADEKLNVALDDVPYEEDEDLSPKANGGIIRRKIQGGIQDICGAVENSLVTIDIVGKFDGRIFDFRKYFEFSLGDGYLQGIPRGVEHALSYFCVREKSVLTLKPEFAFGKEGHGPFDIPPNATVEYEITLKSVDFPIRMDDMSLKEKYVCAQHLKEKGSKFFQLGEFEGAYRKYSQAVNYLSDFELSKEKEDYYDFLKSCYLNLALCSLKTNNPSDAITWGTKVLELRPEDAKGLYRIGLAYLGKQEPRIAKDYFQRVLKVEPDNQAAAKQLLHCEQLEKKVKTLEKQLCLKMFSSQ